MSGGSMDYLYVKVRDANIRPSTPERRAFIAHLRYIAKALHNIEWVDSYDSAEGSETESILKCLTPGVVLEEAISSAKIAEKELHDEIEKAVFRMTLENVKR